MSAILARAARQYVAKNASRAVSHAATAGHGGGFQMWKKLTFFMALPAIGLGIVNVVLAHTGEHAHDRPDFVPYEYLRIRSKRFPWGDGNHSLFHNPHFNALPTGYEDH